jgi:hypothetical protein
MLLTLLSFLPCLLEVIAAATFSDPEKWGEFQDYQFAIIAVCWNPLAKMPSNVVTKLQLVWVELV